MQNCSVRGPALAKNEDGSFTETTREVNPLDAAPWDFRVQYDAATGQPLFALSHYDCLNALKNAVRALDARLAALKPPA